MYFTLYFIINKLILSKKLYNKKRTKKARETTVKQFKFFFAIQ